MEKTTAKNLQDRLETLVEKKRDFDYTLSNVKQAEEMGINYNTFYKYLTAQAACPAHNLVKISKYYNVSTDYLLGLVEPSTTNQTVRSICDYTGLSENAIQELHSYRHNGSKTELDIIAFMIEEKFFKAASYDICQSISIRKKLRNFREKLLPACKLSADELNQLQTGINNDLLWEKYEKLSTEEDEIRKIMAHLETEYNGTLWVCSNRFTQTLQNYLNTIIRSIFSENERSK